MHLELRLVGQEIVRRLERQLDGERLGGPLGAIRFLRRSRRDDLERIDAERLRERLHVGVRRQALPGPRGECRGAGAADCRVVGKTVEEWGRDIEDLRFLKHRVLAEDASRFVAALLDYEYPGNIRELENMIESAVILSEDDVPLDVPLLFASTPGAVRRSLEIDSAGRLEPATDSNLSDLARTIVEAGLPVEPLFSAIVEQALVKAKGNYTHAAKRVGLTRAQLAYRSKLARNRKRLHPLTRLSP
jgi:hypothetical protein